MDGCVSGWMDGWLLDGWVDESMDRWMGEWMDGRLRNPHAIKVVCGFRPLPEKYLYASGQYRP